MTEARIETKVFTIKKEKGRIIINDNLVQPDIYKENDFIYNVISEGVSYNVVIHKIDHENKEVRLSINGKQTIVSLKTQTELLLKSLGIDLKTTAKIDNLKAPMPGLIQSIAVTEGQSLKKGEPILILEAMKMENVIKAPSDVVVEKIMVSPKASVEKGAVLVSFKK